MSKKDSLHRPKPTRNVNPTFLLVCEGKVTERRYFVDLKSEYKIPINIKFHAGATPLTLVQEAARRKKIERKKKTGRDFDHIWVLFDIDDHPYIPEAKQQARDNGIPTAISNPCFELWAFLHFQDQHGYIHRDHLKEACKERMPGYIKKLPFEKLVPGIGKAVVRAEKLREQHERNGTPGENPSTDVDLLVKAITSAIPGFLAQISTAGTTLVR